MRHSQPVLLILLLALAGCGGTKERIETPVDKAKQFVFQKDLDGALKQCEDILADDPRDLEAILVLEEVHRKRGHDDLAIEACTRAIEVAPADPRAYQKRSDLFLSAADAVNDEDEKWRLRELAFADLQAMKERDPDARAALAHIPRDPPKVLNRPIPKADLPKEPYKELDAFPKSIDELAGNKAAEDKAANRDAEKEDVRDDSTFVETAQEYAERLAREAKEIREKELGGLFQEPVLPPHSEPEPIVEEPITPRPPIAKLGLPVRDDGSLILPEFRGNVTTGIRPMAPEMDAPYQELSAPNNRFYLQNQFGVMQQGVRTGIGSSTTRTRPTSQIWQLQSGLLPPDARNSFGPRIRQHTEGDAGGEGSNFAKDPTRPNPPPTTAPGLAPNTPILTTALPGTTMLYGTNPNNKTQRYTTAREFPVTPTSPVRDARRFGNITDPTFTPFGKRPTAPTTPTLPPLGTSSN